ncbi:hypothetical protein ECTOBSL9_1555 [Ectothiorhodospira sp. BSL-9]|nr:hypothetical protein ECTOBSL9_1555 [Ectothiorhodospira sp. BSL-9]
MKMKVIFDAQDSLEGMVRSQHQCLTLTRAQVYEGVSTQVDIQLGNDLMKQSMRNAFVTFVVAR